jgi:very-short-patch-repair endonuclease
VDFYCAERHLVLEIDRSIHRTVAQAEYDVERTQYLELRGLRVIRITNEEVSEASLRELLQNLPEHSPSPRRGEGVRG